MNKRWFMAIGVVGAAVLLLALDHTEGTKLGLSKKDKTMLAVIGAAPFSGANPDDLKKQAEEQKMADIEAEAAAKAKAEEQVKQSEAQPKPATWPPEKQLTTKPSSVIQPKNNAVPAGSARSSTSPNSTPGSSDPGTGSSPPSEKGTGIQNQDKQDFIRGY